MEKRIPKKLGVWTNGTLRLQTRDHDAAYEAANRWMNEKLNVWVAPLGTVVTF